ncbi:MAG: hypothetical protein EB084_26025, partial [Proteobacteria bacterium]|nr:hypothetical protein [Pseudomonadota bacterium]
MARADRLLEHLRKAGTVDSEGFFTLDGRKAQAKMREYALVDAHEYVLEIIRAAVVGGASRIDVTADAQGVSVSAPGWRVSDAFLEDPFAGIFLSQERNETLDWRHLAIGLNAALSLNPRAVEVRVGKQRLRIDSADTRTLHTEATEQVGTRVDVIE